MCCWGRSRGLPQRGASPACLTRCASPRCCTSPCCCASPRCPCRFTLTARGLAWPPTPTSTWPSSCGGRWNSCSTAGRCGARCLRFLRRGAARASRAAQPWAAEGGCPPVSPGSHAPPPHCPVRPRQVDVSWTGHHHSYQRTCPVFQGRCLGRAADGTAQAPVHLVIGEGPGAGTRAQPCMQLLHACCCSRGAAAVPARLRDLALLQSPLTAPLPLPARHRPRGRGAHAQHPFFPAPHL